MLTGLSKIFDCLDHGLIIAKLNSYGFSWLALKLIHNYVSYRKQRIRIYNSHSEWLDMILRVPQGFMLGPLLFNVFLGDLFFMLGNIDIENLPDDNIPYISAKNVDDA